MMQRGSTLVSIILKTGLMKQDNPPVLHRL